MKRTTLLLVIVSFIAVLFCGLWVRTVTGYHAEMEQRCQYYAEQAAGGLSSYEKFKGINDESYIGQYWSSVANFYAFKDTLYSLADNGGWNEALYNDCNVLYDHMLLAPEKVFAHMDDVLAALELLGKDYTSPDAGRAMNQLAYNLQHNTWKTE